MAFKFLYVATILSQCAAMEPARRRHRDNVPKPEFVNCGKDGRNNVLRYSRLHASACGTDLPLLLIGDVIRPMLEYEQSTVRPKGRKPIIMHLGANTFSESGLYTQMLTDLKKGSGDEAFRVVLVEMVSQFNSHIMKTVARLPVAPANVQLVNAMIQGHCQAPSEHYYFVSSQLWEDHPEVGNLIDRGIGCATTSRKAVEKCTAFHLKHFSGGHPEKYNLTKYITENTVQCLEPRQLLEQIQAEPSDLAYLTTDCEGADEHYYFVSSQLWEDHPEVGNLIDRGIGCATTSPAAAEKCTAFHLKHFGGGHPEKYNLTKYITENTVQCLEPRQLLEQIQAEPSDLAYLTTDCEGADAGIVRGLLDQGVRAPFISMEGVPYVAPFAELQQAGYKIGIHCEGNCSDPDDPFGGIKDTIAIRGPVPQLHPE
eukprot:CAMPEP_0204610352 /NCGR_PEP_ID=MMETSP0661-20131031/61458_1 /ASSEMBLY_ACC=CAM_ASM_000606 /TAXON_ID=109239 /ORGANISM="Alexandrium margalefi, Strain AMGDE01CS-322" /LENGTH=425 /DNA_ID=CAMNT_0051622159 /DNA_START=98 /DNA_END=1375 /DNA_ORIENTATION=+